MITGTLPPKRILVPVPVPAPEPIPVIWDTTWDYRESEGRFYARPDVDHKVYMAEDEHIWVNPNTGEIKNGR